MPYVYILRCKDNSLYTGWTTNLQRRVEEHSNGTGAKYTRGRGPIKLVYYEKLKDKREAAKREYAIKRWTKAKKEQLIRTSNGRVGE